MLRYTLHFRVCTCTIPGETGANNNGERWIVSDISHHYEVDSWGQLVRGSI